MINRDEYVAKLKSQLDTWNAEAAKWEAKAKAAEADMKAEYEHQLATLDKQREDAAQRLQQVQAAAGDAWRDMVRGSDEAWKRMSDAFSQARSHFDRK